MTEQEIRAWLGLGPEADNRALRPEIIAGMRDLPVPSTDAGQVDTFKAWLKSAGPLRPGQIFASPVLQEEDGAK